MAWEGGSHGRRRRAAGTNPNHTLPVGGAKSEFRIDRWCAVRVRRRSEGRTTRVVFSSLFRPAVTNRGRKLPMERGRTAFRHG